MTNPTATAPFAAEILKKAGKALDRAKAAMVLKKDSAFFTSMAYSFKYVWDEAIPTACVNSFSFVVRINPTFFLGLPEPQRVFVVVHETMHPAFMHAIRMGNRDPEVWGDACDHSINLQLKASGFEMPTWVLADDRFTGMSVEQIYNILIAENPPQPKKPGAGLPGTIPGPNMKGDIEPDEKPPTPERIKEVEQQVREVLIRAQIRAKQEGGGAPGNIPDEIQVYLDGVLNPKLPWHRLLAKYVHQAAGKEDYTRSRPNRRFLPDYYMPSLIGSRLEHLAAAVDISSSVTDDEFHQQISEIAGIFKMLNPKRITLILFNTKVVSTFEVHSLKELMAVQFTGRGGTRIGPVIDWLNEHKPSLALVLSDGGFHWPEGATSKVPTFWVVYDKPEFEAPFGKVVHYQINH